MKYKWVYLSVIFLGLFAAGCKKETIAEINDEADFSEGTSNMTFHFRGKINGVQKDWTVSNYKNGENLPFRFNSASAVQALGEDCKTTYCKYMIEDVVIFQNNGAGPTKNYIAAGFNISSKTGDRNEIIQQFSPGLKEFGKPRTTINDPVKDGIYVYYIDENGKEWCSHYGTGLQSTSTFNSISLSTQPFNEISCTKIWTAKFSCTLYDRNGNSIQVVDGEFFSPVLVKK